MPNIFPPGYFDKEESWDFLNETEEKEYNSLTSVPWNETKERNKTVFKLSDGISVIIYDYQEG